MNLENILKKLNLEDLNKYFKSATMDKPVYSSKSNNLEIHFHLEFHPSFLGDEFECIRSIAK